jgi:murein DD-endopeptidase MepM/ murein hydrolase activator NlpD
VRVTLGLDLFSTDRNRVLAAFAQGQQGDFEIRPDQLPDPVAKIVRDHKAEFGDSIDSEEELRELMKLLEQTGGDLNGLPRPDFKNLDGMSAQDMLQMLIDWIQNGGAQSNANKPRSLGSLGSRGSQSMQPSSWNGANNGFSGSSGAAPSAGTSAGPSGGSAAPAASPANITAPPQDVKRGPTSGGMVMPVEGTITSRFGPRNDPIDGHADTHTGLDISAPGGTPIQAAKDGVVKIVGDQGDGYGNKVVIDHGDGTQTLYGHASALHVQEGQQVKAGDVIASVGSTGHSTGNHLHFEVIVNGQPVDPSPYLGL